MLTYTLAKYIELYKNPLSVGTMFYTTEGTGQYIVQLVYVNGQYLLIAVSDGFVYKPSYDEQPTIIDIKECFESHGHEIEIITKNDMVNELIEFLKSKKVIK